MWILTQRFFAGRFAIGLTWRQRFRTTRDDAKVLALHTYLWLENELSVGVLGEQILRWETPDLRSVPIPSKEIIHDGYRSRGNPPVEAHEVFTYTHKLKELQKHPASSEYGDAASQWLLRREQDLAARHGAQLVLLVPPTLKPSKFLPDPRQGATPMLLDLDRPAEFPELFDLRNRRDETHLNERGAEILTGSSLTD
jgi:hypothetical protein